MHALPKSASVSLFLRTVLALDPVAEWIRHWILASSRSKDREQRVRGSPTLGNHSRRFESCQGRRFARATSFHDPVAEWIRRWILTRLKPSGRGAVTNQLMQVRILPGSLLFVFNACCNAISMLGPSFTSIARPCGLMDKALVFGTKDCRFKSCQGHFFTVGE